MLMEISAAVAAAAFVGLAVYLIALLRKGMMTLEETNRTLSEVRGAVHGLSGEAARLLRNANQVTRDVESRIHAIDPLLESVQDVGEVLQTVTESVRKAALNPVPAGGAAQARTGGADPGKPTGSQIRVTLK